MLLSIPSGKGQSVNKPVVNILLYPDSVLNDVSNHPIGINLDYLTDDDNYLHPKRRLADALKAMGVKYLRYPGGNKSDFYFFSRPPYEKSEPTLARTGKDAVVGRNRALNATATDFKNDVLDFDEFMNVCREVDAEPVIVVAADEYLVNYPPGSTWSTKDQLLKNAVEWVKYANIKKKYGVKYWMIANETWNSENKNSSVDIYAQDVIDFSKAMKAVDPTIWIIPNGNSDAWWKTILTRTSDYIDAICISNYPVYNYKVGYQTYRDTIHNLMGPVQKALIAIDKYASPDKKKKLKLIVAEYGPFDWTGNWPFINNMGLNLANFEITGLQLCEPRIEFSCFWNTRWIDNDIQENKVYDALDKEGNFNANGLGLMIWGNFLGTKMIKVSQEKNIRTFSSYDPEKKALFLYILNVTDMKHEIILNIEGYKIKSIVQAWELSGKNPEDTDPVWQKIFPESDENLSVNGTSIGVFEFNIE